MEITTIDCRYLQPEFAASYLVGSNGEFAFVEANTNYAVPVLLAELKRQQIERAKVKWIALTHIHLDHAGGVGRLLEALPNATVICHPRATRHLIDPSRLEMSARKVYGDSEFERLYGQLIPVPSGRIKSLEDQESLTLGNERFQFFHTRGHANHHGVYWFPTDGTIFTGDAYGLCYPELSRNDKPNFIFPSTSPTDFNFEEARKTIGLINSLNPRRAGLTHFGLIEKPTDEKLIRQLLGDLEKSQELLDLAKHHKSKGKQFEESEHEIFAFLLDYFKSRYLGLGGSWTDRVEQILLLDIKLNAQGLVYAAFFC